MKIVLATPLYPPEIAPTASYVKELAKRLSGTYEVVIVAYAQMPEHVAQVPIVAIDKRQMLVLRLVKYTAALWRAAREANILYVQNGAALELPAALVSFLQQRPLILCMGDTRAEQKAEQSRLLSFIQHIALARAQKVVVDIPPPKPEILPFGPRPEQELAAYERSWQKHLELLVDIFTHAKD